MTQPTIEFFQLMQMAFTHFNATLFQDKLPECMITAQRQRNVMGYFSAERWRHTNGEIAHEIALNPAYFAQHRLIEVLQTLVHEQVHLWQHVFGKHKSRSGYHNREWANKMKSVGLIPSHNGLPGGRVTGQSMSDYPDPNGEFIRACKSLITQGYQLNWIDTEPAIDDSCQPRHEWMESAASTPAEEDSDTDVVLMNLLMQPIIELVPEIDLRSDPVKLQKKQSKSRYSCPSCSVHVWGKPDLNLICGDCGVQLKVDG